MKNIISVKNLSKTYKYNKRKEGAGFFRSLFAPEHVQAKAVKNISFEIAEGELVGFLGPNGAGKTTTLKMLSGILYPTSGHVSVLGYEPAKRNHAMQKQFALVMGNKNQLWWDLPSVDTFLLNKEIYELTEKEYQRNLAELSEMLDAGDVLSTPVRKLSLGQRMKCELIASLLHNPKVLLLDEPTLGLDVVAQKNIREFIKTYNEQKKTTIILTSHYMDDIRELAKRVLVIYEGEIIYDGQLSALVTKYAPHKFLKLKFETTPITKADVTRYGEVVAQDSTSITVRVSRPEAKKVASELLNSQLPIDDIDISEPEVEDVIREVFKNGANK